MKFILIALLFLLHYYMVTFAVYNWRNKNKKAVLGTVLLMITVLVMQTLLLFIDI